MKTTFRSNVVLHGVPAILILAFTAFMLIQCKSGTPVFDEALVKTASELNSNCPMMVDQETRLDNAVALPGKVFQYNYTLVNILKDSLDVPAFEEAMRPMILGNVKTNPDLQQFRDNGVTMAYYYKDRAGTFLSRITIAPDDYNEK